MGIAMVTRIETCTCPFVIACLARFSNTFFGVMCVQSMKEGLLIKEVDVLWLRNSVRHVP